MNPAGPGVSHKRIQDIQKPSVVLREMLIRLLLDGRVDEGTDDDSGAWMVSPHFVDAEEFAIGTVSLLTLVGLAGPLLFVCHTHLADGHFVLGCSYGTLGITVTGFSGRMYYSSLRKPGRKFSGSWHAGASE